MPKPVLRICPHRPMDILKTAELLYYYSHEIPYNESNDDFRDPAKTKNLTTTLGVMRSLSKVYNALEHIPDEANKDVKKKLSEWRKIKDDLMSESVLITLTDNLWHFTVAESSRMLVMFCEKEGMECKKSKDFYFKHFYRVDTYQQCVMFDMTLGHPFHEATSQGIRNGLTIIALTENTLLNKAFNLPFKSPVPGMSNVLSPDRAMNGIRLLVGEAGMLSPPRIYGLDLPPGASATIGITAKKIHHLQHPYTNCAVIDYEKNNLMQAIKIKHPDIIPAKETPYSTSLCR